MPGGERWTAQLIKRIEAALPVYGFMIQILLSADAVRLEVSGMGLVTLGRLVDSELLRVSIAQPDSVVTACEGISNFQKLQDCGQGINSELHH